MLPSEKAEKKAADRARLEADLKEQAEHLRHALNGCFSTPDGIEVLRWLKGQCGYGHAIPMSDDRSMALMVMRHNLYCEIRKHLETKTLMEVEL